MRSKPNPTVQGDPLEAAVDVGQPPGGGAAKGIRCAGGTFRSRHHRSTTWSALAEGTPAISNARLTQVNPCTACVVA